jgi:hypothetical protein
MPQVTIRRPFGELDLGDHLLSRGSRVSDVFSVSLNHFIRPRQYIRWDRKTDLFGCLEVDYQLEMSWASTGKSCGFVPLRIRSTYHALRWPMRYLSAS